MLKTRVILAALLLGLMLGGCGDIALFGKPTLPANAELASGIKSYEDGYYKTALLHLQQADEIGLNDNRDKIVAHKYLAFIHCISKREQECREEFRKALEINPAFELEPAEAGHPIWGPIFRVEKLKFTK
jgi:Tfp pilus assembly protein PilF